MIRKLLALGLPLAIGFISQTTISFTDAMLISRLGNQDLSGATLGISLFSLVMLMGIGIILAFGPHMARAFRQDDVSRLRKWFAQGIWLALILGVVGMMDTRWPTLVVIGSYWVIGLGGGFLVARLFHAGFYSYWLTSSPTFTLRDTGGGFP